MTGWRERTLADLLAANGLSGVEARPLETDGWSGSTFSTLERDGQRFVLKHVSADRDWIVRATRDDGLREAAMAASGRSQTHLGAAADPDGGAAILMPDLSGELMTWEQETGTAAEPELAALDVDGLDHLLDRIAALHAAPWTDGLDVPWCPIAERLTLLSPASAAGYTHDGNPVGPIFEAGWAAFERVAPVDAVDLVRRLSDDVEPLVRSLRDLPDVGLHGDLKLANVARFVDGSVGFIDWQMTMRAPVAVELGWLLVSNSGELPLPAPQVLERYRVAAQRHAVPGTLDDDEWAAQCDLAAISGLLLRGWRKGRDREGGVTLGSGVSAAEDLAWWTRSAVEAAARRL